MRGSALSCMADCGAYLQAPDALECLAAAVSDQGAYTDAARLLAIGQPRSGTVPGWCASPFTKPAIAGLLAKLRKELPPSDFDSAWTEGYALAN